MIVKTVPVIDPAITMAFFQLRVWVLGSEYSFNEKNHLFYSNQSRILPILTKNRFKAVLVSATKMSHRSITR